MIVTDLSESDKTFDYQNTSLFYRTILMIVIPYVHIIYYRDLYYSLCFISVGFGLSYLFIEKLHAYKGLKIIPNSFILYCIQTIFIVLFLLLIEKSNFKHIQYNTFQDYTVEVNYLFLYVVLLLFTFITLLHFIYLKVKKFKLKNICPIILLVSNVLSFVTYGLEQLGISIIFLFISFICLIIYGIKLYKGVSNKVYIFWFYSIVLFLICFIITICLYNPLKLSKVNFFFFSISFYPIYLIEKFTPKKLLNNYELKTNN